MFFKRFWSAVSSGLHYCSALCEVCNSVTASPPDPFCIDQLLLLLSGRESVGKVTLWGNLV